MEKSDYVIKKIYDLHKLAIREMDKNVKLIRQPYDMFEKQDPVYCNPTLFQSICQALLNSKAKCFLMMDDDFMYSAFQFKDSYVILGPVTLEEKNEFQKHRYLLNHQVRQNDFVIPQINLLNFKKITSFVYGILTEDYSEEEYLFEDEMECKLVEDAMHQELTEYILSNAEQEQIHFSFQEEKKQAEHIIEGNYEYFSPKNNSADNIYRQKYIGKMAKSNSKQYEYECVCWITLMTRYVIEAGVSDAKSYALSDVTLQKLSTAANTVEMERIFNASMKEFSGLVKEAKNLQGQNSPYVERCKDYIAKHIYEKIALEDIAKEIGIHPVYLSHIFSESMRMPISAFIMQEKVKVSCNLLKYSGKSIAAIAEYMNLAPQSYFARVFKKVMNQTPGQYQNVHRDKKFYES